MIRTPALWIDLPSQGKFYTPNIAKNQAILHQTAADEISLRNADGLFNGQSTSKAVQSCVPSIVDAANMPIIDLPVILAAIRIAINGNSLDFEVECNNCKHREEKALNLNSVLLTNTDPRFQKWQEPLRFDAHQVHLRPMSYAEWTVSELHDFRIRKTYLQISQSPDIQQHQELIKSLKQQSAAQDFADTLLQIKGVDIGDFFVSSKDHIREWLNNCDFVILEKITARLQELNAIHKIPAVEISCSKCQTTQNVNIDLDWSVNFRNKIFSKTPAQVEAVLKDLESETMDLQKDLLKIVWYMRGGVSLTEAQNLSLQERKIISDIIKENMETTAKTKIPFI